MGLHTGPAEFREGDYFGPPLNRVARMMAAGHGGQVLVSVAAQEACGQTLPEGASLVPLGEFALKDLPQPQVFYQLIHPSLRSTFPALRTAAAQETVPSIAVLPFVNMSHDEENEYFADGLSEELLNVLGQDQGLPRGIAHVCPHLQGQGDRHPSAAQQLQVANVLAGSVRKAGKRVRISTAAGRGDEGRDAVGGDVRPRARRHLRGPGRHRAVGGRRSSASGCSASPSTAPRPPR